MVPAGANPAGRGRPVPAAHDHRYRKTSRLRKAAEFRRVLRRGRRRRGSRFDVAVARRDEASGARLGIAVPRAFGGAVARNRLKRVVREYFRRHLHQLKADVDIVIIARPGPGRVSREELREIERLLERTSAWNDDRSRSAPRSS